MKELRKSPFLCMKPGFGARYFVVTSGFPSGASDNPPASAGDVRDTGLIPGSGRSPGDGDGNPFQYSCLENPMDKRSLVAELDTTEAAERIRTSLLEACSSGLVMRRGEGCVVAAPLWERGGPGEEGSAGE